MLSGAKVAINRVSGYVAGRIVLNKLPQADRDRSPVTVAKENADTHRLAAEMLMRTQKLYGSFVVVDPYTYAAWVNYELLRDSQQWKDYVIFSRRLWHIDLLAMAVPHRIAFLLNTYNALIFHATIEVQPKKTVEKLSMFSTCSYGIGGQHYSLDEIENGLLRGNRLPPGSLHKPFSNKKDERRKFCLAEAEVDPRIHFALNCGAQSCPSVRFYDGDKLEQQLSMAAEQFCEQAFTVLLPRDVWPLETTDTDQKADVEDHKQGVDFGHATVVVRLSPIFKWYRKDFTFRHSDDSDATLLRAISSFIPQAPAAKLRGAVDLALLMEKEHGDAAAIDAGGKKKKQKRKSYIKLVWDDYDWTTNSLKERRSKI